ncbi:AfsA-related hotdog domain-containing protein [Sphaerisporangium sp. B11E5]|uniref:AfsA-related hotdog domain-containing protein n=1 Tax=Sphaerisporangium sp. B11E5 TaxID=3153563 RepID=UPI00325F8AFE
MSHSPLRAPAAAPASDWLSVITPAEPDGAVLRVDQDHPFFFDHPLDHVPGMLLVTGLLDLARARAGVTSGGHATRLRLRFLRMCELEGRISLRADPVRGGPRGAFAVQAVQDDATVCEGTVELTPAAHGDPGPGGRGGPVPVRPVTRDLVHRADAWNVVLGDLVVTPERYEARLLSPPAGHFLLRHGAGTRAAEEIVESGRQLITAAMHLTHGRPRDTAMLWLTLTADLPALTRHPAPLALRWETTPPRGDRAAFDIAVLSGDTRVGTLAYATKCMTPAGYARFRATRRAA